MKFGFIASTSGLAGGMALRSAGWVPGGEFLDPFAQHVLVHVQITRRLRCRYATLADQLHRLDLESPVKPSPSHRQPPVPSSTLTRGPLKPAAAQTGEGRAAVRGSRASEPPARAPRRLQREQDPKSPFVFTSERGSPFTTAGFARMIERADVEAGFGLKAHPHVLRHACGFALANKGA